MFEKIETLIPDCFILKPRVFNDARGSFVKTFQSAEFDRLKLFADFKEEYFSFSRRNVIRGLHFQTPPAEHTKLVCCIQGQVTDVVVDLRVGSPSFKKYVSIELAGHESTAIYIPVGCAHGFISQTDNSLMLYKVSSVHSPENDTGILYSSIGFDWKTDHPIVSSRDQAFVSLDKFQTPFVYNP